MTDIEQKIEEEGKVFIKKKLTESKSKTFGKFDHIDHVLDVFLDMVEYDSDGFSESYGLTKHKYTIVVTKHLEK